MSNKKHFLPITKKEAESLGWNEVDVVLITGDAYVDHPSFGAAIIGRILEESGLRVAIVPQPNWKDDLRDFKKFGKPRLFFAITAGNMDSMVNHYTANKRLRSDDAYTPGGQAGFRPDYATVTYSNIVKKLYPDVPVVIGGVEASMRRLSHYDYWSDQLRPSILLESQADLLIYGMGEKPVKELVTLFHQKDWKSHCHTLRQIAFLTEDIKRYQAQPEVMMLHAYEAELKQRKCYGENFVAFETEANKKQSKTLIQPCGGKYLVVTPPHPPATEAEMDSWAMYDRMMNLPHPKYAKRGDIPAFEMIKNSITIHRGCFGGCSFCTISAHQGKFISSRSKESILKEVEDLAQRPYFKGHISDVGGPSANMYRMRGVDEAKCSACRRSSCLIPNICKNMDINHKPLISLYHSVREIKGVKQVTIGSGIRYEMLLTKSREEDKKNGLSDYLSEIVNHHVSGRLKVAPEHTSPHVVAKMRKPSFEKFLLFLEQFNMMNRKSGKNQQLIPYFISAHPGCTVEDMASLAVEARNHRLMTDQVQEFTPTPMTYSTAIYYLGYDPYTGEKMTVQRYIDEKKAQHLFFFAGKKENRNALLGILKKHVSPNSMVYKHFFSYFCR